MSINAEIEKKLSEEKGEIFIDFYASWCGPCKMMAPVIDEIEKEITDIEFLKIDIDKERELADKFRIMSVPTFVFLKDGSETARTLGGQPKGRLLDFISKAREENKV